MNKKRFLYKGPSGEEEVTVTLKEHGVVIITTREGMVMREKAHFDQAVKAGVMIPIDDDSGRL